MKPLKELIQEKLKISKTQYTLFPKTKEELYKMIKNEIKQNGNRCSLNHIDVSEITDMSYLFLLGPDIDAFNGDISGWNVSSVENMAWMFAGSKFNHDISNWDVSGVKNMGRMFDSSNFIQDISQWDVSSVEDMRYMFYGSKFNNDISDWDVSKVNDMEGMFMESEFNQDISKWNVSSVKNMRRMFNYSKFNNDISNWKINVDCKTYEMFDKCNIEHKYKPKGI